MMTSTGMKAGILNKRVSLQRKAGKDPLGQPLNTWTEYARPWANVRMLTGKETANSSKPVTTASGSIRIRYRTDVLASDRAVLGDGTVFNIVAVLPNVDSNEYTDLVVNTGANDG